MAKNTNDKRVYRTLNHEEMSFLKKTLEKNPIQDDASIANQMLSEGLGEGLPRKVLRDKIRRARVKIVDENGIRTRCTHHANGTITVSQCETSKPDNPDREFLDDTLLKQAGLNSDRFYLKAYTESQVENKNGRVMTNTHKKFVCLDPNKFNDETATENAIKRLAKELAPCSESELSNPDMLPALYKAYHSAVNIVPNPKGTYSIVLPHTDLHIGEGDCQKMVKSYEATMQNFVFPQLKERYFNSKENKVRTIDIVCMGDLVHCDNGSGTTTAGTALQPKSDAYESFDACVDYFDWFIPALRTTFKVPIRFIYVYGNHDNNIGFGIVRVLARAYKFVKGIEFMVNESISSECWYKEAERNPEYMWVQYGDVGITYTHGKFMKKNMKEIPEVANPNARRDVKFNAVIYGHLHHINAASSSALQHNFGISTPNFVRDKFGKTLGCVTDPEFYIFEVNHITNRVNYTPIPSLPYNEQPKV